MNSFGKNLRLTTFWESHWNALWAVVDGCPAWIELCVEDIQAMLDRRKPWQSKISTQRKEGDRAEILSWVFEWKTLWTPIAVIVRNEDQRSKDYSNIKDLFRPWHADEAWDMKYWLRDYRWWWRSSWRETIWRVIGGAIANKIIEPTGLGITASVIQVWDIHASAYNSKEIENNSVRCADPKAAIDMEAAIIKAKQEWESLWAIVRLQIKNCPAWLWEPVFNKLQALMSHAFFSIWTVRSVELMPWKEVVKMKWSQSNKISSWVSWWISTWSDIIFDIWIKPTPSVGVPQDMNKKWWWIESDAVIVGRHDPCIAPRAVPVVEAMAAMVLADFYLESRLNKI